MGTFAPATERQAVGPQAWLPASMPASRMLHFLGPVCRRLREDSGTKAVRVAARVNKSEAAVTRFEKGLTQPDDLDGMITAFSDELEIEPALIWRQALEDWLVAPDEIPVTEVPPPPASLRPPRAASPRTGTDRSQPDRSRTGPRAPRSRDASS